MTWKIQKPTFKGVLYGIWTAVALVLSSVNIGVMSLYYATHTFGTEMFDSYFENYTIAVLNIVPVILLMMVLYFVFRRLWAAHLVTGLAVLILTWVNYFKLQFRDDPLMAEDFSLVAEAENMAGNYDIQISIDMVLCLALVAAITVIMFFAANAHFRSVIVQAAGVIVSAVLLGCFMVFFVLNSHFYASVVNDDLINSWSTTQVYVSKGFVYPFLNSLNSAFPQKPEGYTKEAAEAILDNYETATIPDDRKVNVIGVMLEAFNDFSKYDQIEWVDDPYDILHDIEDESIHGNIITNIFAGGTVDTERCFLTGFADLGSLRHATPSYVRYFKSQGYTVEGAHPSYAWFYNRENINANLGFDEYYYFENRYEELTDGSVAKDNIFFEDLYDLYKDGTKKDNPYFSFSVTYQNHGPYEVYLTSNSDRYVSEKYSDEEEYIADNYFSGIRDTSRQIRSFLDRLKEDKEPVVVVMFGDHNPWFGDGNSVYDELGINIDTNTEEGFLNYYETCYFIWANDSAREILNNDFTGEGPDIGPYFLMNVLFDECGWVGNSYMQFTDDVMDATPLLHTTGAYMSWNHVATELTERRMELVRQFDIVQYYMKYDAQVAK